MYISPVFNSDLLNLIKITSPCSLKELKDAREPERPGVIASDSGLKSQLQTLADMGCIEITEEMIYFRRMP